MAMEIAFLQSNNRFEKKREKIQVLITKMHQFDKKKVRCYQCSELGHFARECTGKKVDSKTRTITEHSCLLPTRPDIDDTPFFTYVTSLQTQRPLTLHPVFQVWGTAVKSRPHRLFLLKSKRAIYAIREPRTMVDLTNLHGFPHIDPQGRPKSVLTSSLPVIRLKGKNVLDNATTITNATTIAPGMFKLDIKPLSHRLKNNGDAHEDYLKKTIENTDTIHGLVERARKQNPSEPLLDSACKFTKHVQELLFFVSQTCPSFINLVRNW
ncbi:retrovirus-related pol polyprotein from transposon TNT 1-94 [Tanacetum coccineum]